MPSPESIERDRLELVGRLFPGIAHELGNPLNSITTLAQMAARGSQDPECERKLGKIVAHTSRIQGLVREVLALTEPSDSRPQLLDVDAWIEAAQQLQRFDRRGHRVTLTREVPTPAPRVRGVRDHLVHALGLYLMAAARDLVLATPPRSRELRVRVTETERVRVQIEPATSAPGADLEFARAILVEHGGEVAWAQEVLSLDLPRGEAGP